MKKIIIVLLLSLTSFFVFAAETLQILKPKAGQHELNIEGKYLDMSIPSSESVYYGPEAHLSYYYGLNDSNSLGLETSYIEAYQQWWSTKGISENVLKYKGNYNFQSFTLYYTAGYMFGLETPVTNVTNSSSNTLGAAPSNNAFEFELGSILSNSGLNFGFLLTSRTKQTGKSITVFSSGTSEEVTYPGGEGLKQQIIFIELDNPLHPNFAIGQLFFPGYTYTSNSGGRSSTSSFSYDIYSLSGRWDISERIQILPKIERRVSTYLSTRYTVNVNYLGATLRMLF